MNIQKPNLWFLALSLFSTLVLASCAPTPKAPELTAKPILSGRIATAGVVIEAVDGSFTLRAGETFQSPFQMGRNFPLIWNKNDIIDAYDRAHRYGAQPVRVTVPGQGKPLNGILALNAVTATATGPASRAYLIRIPQKYIDATQGGRVSVVYEQVDPGFEISGSDIIYAGWILWLSDMRF